MKEYTEKNMLDFAKWWYGPDSEVIGCGNSSIESGFEYWKKKVYIFMPEDKSCPLYVDYKKSCEALKKHQKENKK